MRVARWSSALFLGSVAGLTGTLVLLSPSTGEEDPVRPDRGTLAPVLDPAPDRVVAARVDARLGPILDLDSSGKGLAVLASEGWVLFAGGEPEVVWERDRQAGSPDWLSRPVSIATGFGRIFVLDAGRSMVSVWDSAGNRLPDLPVPRQGALNQSPASLHLGPDGMPMVTLQRVDADGTATWNLLGLEPDGTPREILSLPSRSRTMVFEGPLLAWADSGLFSMHPLTHELSWVDPGMGASTALFVRPTPPLWRVPERHRREYERMLRGFGGVASGLSRLPDFWPSVRDFTVTGAGCFLTAVTAGEERRHVEALASDLTPIGRFDTDGFVEPVFLSGGRAFLVEASPDETVIHELVVALGPHGSGSMQGC